MSIDEELKKCVTEKQWVIFQRSKREFEKIIERMNCYINNQPERSKREDSQCHNCFELEQACGNSFSKDGICPYCERLVRCGALNSMET